MALYLEQTAGGRRIIGLPSAMPPARHWSPLDLEAQEALKRAGIHREIVRRNRTQARRDRSR